MEREWREEAQGHIWVVKVEVRKCGCQSLREGSEWEKERGWVKVSGLGMERDWVMKSCGVRVSGEGSRGEGQS